MPGKRIKTAEEIPLDKLGLSKEQNVLYTLLPGENKKVLELQREAMEEYYREHNIGPNMLDGIRQRWK